MKLHTPAWAGAMALALMGSLAAADAPKKTVPAFTVPVTYYKLPNGLKIALSPDHTAPTVAVAVYYKIGFRVEPRDRTGFAHLFEHMMFQGSKNLGKMEFIRLVEQNGGILNGSTRFDFTNYYEMLPAHKLETALWAEADRMKGLAITQENLTNQKAVVSNEVKVNVINQPYGGFPWLDVPQYANTNWHNAHNFYGELKEIEAATLEDVSKFFKTYYAPNNAALAIVGDFEVAQAKTIIEKYFGPISSAQPAKLPDLSEPRQEKEKRFNKKDALANRPALAIAYHVPERNSPEYYAMGLIDEILLQGNDSLLYQELVKKRALTGRVSGGINLLGDMFNYSGPMLWTASLFHDSTTKPDDIVDAFESVIRRLQEKPVEGSTLDRALVKMRSRFYDSLVSQAGVGRADLLASFALFDDDPGRVNKLEAEFRKVTPALIQKTAKEYLRAGNRTILTIEPGAAPAPKAAESKPAPGTK
ncbi:MAG TPA: pitrilysin family protein [Bryobacteraceae bacterium]|nr:pitrilysin family protein [Bryobacteraceae bacterium]